MFIAKVTRHLLKKRLTSTSVNHHVFRLKHVGLNAWLNIVVKFWMLTNAWMANKGFIVLMTWLIIISCGILGAQFLNFLRYASLIGQWQKKLIKLLTKSQKIYIAISFFKASYTCCTSRSWGKQYGIKWGDFGNMLGTTH